MKFYFIVSFILSIRLTLEPFTARRPAAGLLTLVLSLSLPPFLAMASTDQPTTRSKAVATNQQELWKELEERKSQLSTQQNNYQQETSSNFSRLEEELHKINQKMQRASQQAKRLQGIP
ncbi:hypothetical protein KSP39_PZI018811 [Platanthera zijinensis]|uniref:Uncharacterized protein n=1 Tax=Platanthera zijinensis TaxID=2320716 RepID=A0AAP0B589_9ASPA